MSRLKILRLRATRRVDAIGGGLEARIADRRRLYRRHGLEVYARAEVAFMRWMQARGALAPLDDPRAPGSAWWQAVNREICLDSQLASLVHDAHLDWQQLELEAPVRAWLRLFAAPSAGRWYRAHNASVMLASLKHRALAAAEPRWERAFINIALYRMLALQAVAEGAALGRLGAILSHPRVPLVDLFVGRNRLYPRRYPVSERDLREGLLDGAAGGRLALNPGMLSPAELMPLAAGWLELPDVARIVMREAGGYPDLAEVPEPAEAGQSAAPARRKIAVLGGGPAGLAAAWELTSYDGWERHYEVTVYTLGWRLGGKLATGRGPHGRIEEHGLHILQGWYHNTFRMFDEVFRERRELGLDPEAPFQRLHEGLVREDATLMTEQGAGAGPWTAWQFALPANTRRPGFGGPLGFGALARKAVGVAVGVALGAPTERDGWLRTLLLHPLFAAGPATATAGRPGRRPRDGRRRLERALVTMARALLRRQPAGVVSRLGRLLSAWRPGRAQRLGTLVELTLVIARGVLLDVYDPDTGALNFDAINDLDFRDWLRLHGASARTLGSPLVRFAYTGTFSDMTEGDHGRLAAGTALAVGIRAGGYKGSFVWKLKAGTGDTLLTPLYQVLRARGVKFEFFNRVEKIHASDTGAIEAITVARQVDLRGSGPYEPLVRLGNMWCWPSQPLADQIAADQAAALRERQIDLESSWSPWHDVGRDTLRRGEDFDLAILAIPVGALKNSICSELGDRDPRWQAMLNGIRTTQTQAVQLWLRPSVDALGLDRAQFGMRAAAEANLVTYANPTYSWLDLSSLIAQERWPEDDSGPQSCAYFTGPLPEAEAIPGPDDHAFPGREHARVMGDTRRWLDAHIGLLWPRAVHEGRFDLSLLAAPAQVDRFAAQYFRANVDPWARYTLPYPGTHRVRLRTGASGYNNLWLAGDWIDYGLNVGYIDGAITSGLQAAHAVRIGLDLKIDQAPWEHLQF